MELSVRIYSTIFKIRLHHSIATPWSWSIFNRDDFKNALHCPDINGTDYSQLVSLINLREINSFKAQQY